MKPGDIVIMPVLFRGSAVSEVLGDGRVKLVDPQGHWRAEHPGRPYGEFAALEWTDTAEGQQCMLSGGVVVRRRLREDPFVTLELAYSANGGLATLTVDVRRGSGEQSILCGLLARSDRWRLTQEAYLETLIWRTDPAGHRRGAL